MKIEVYEVEAGWFWGECFENGLPSSSPVGPYETEQEAAADAASAQAAG